MPIEEQLKRVPAKPGVYYADDTPKSSLRVMRNAISALRADRLTRCPVRVAWNPRPVARPAPPPPPPAPHPPGPDGTGR